MVNSLEGVEQIDARIRALRDGGDRAGAVTEVLRIVGPGVLGFLSAVMKNEADADEAFAAVGERLWQSIETFDWRCSIRTWLYVIARREISRHRTGARRQIAARESTPGAGEDVGLAGTTFRSTQERLVHLRDELPDEDRELLVLRVDRALDWEEVALAFVVDPERCSQDDVERTIVQLRRRLEWVKASLTSRAREEGLWSK